MWTVGVNKGNLTLGITVVKAPVWFTYFKVFFLGSHPEDSLSPHARPPTYLSIPYFLIKSYELPIDFTVWAAVLWESCQVTSS